MSDKGALTYVWLTFGPSIRTSPNSSAVTGEVDRAMFLCEGSTIGGTKRVLVAHDACRSHTSNGTQNTISHTAHKHHARATRAVECPFNSSGDAFRIMRYMCVQLYRAMQHI
mmetsp:Transcript_26225/g.59922  ORF Transcript_26225/g.59922 Transcript_26225/m.59922 type:complete len:112 (-) Transcript_26225:1145-1480(-)